MVLITIKSSDPIGKSFEVEESAALASQTIKHMIEDLEDPIREITIPEVTITILAKVVDYLNMHDPDNVARVGINCVNRFDTYFVRVYKNTLFDLIKAASFLCIKGMMDITLDAAVEFTGSMSMDELREYFNVKEQLLDEEDSTWIYDYVYFTPELKPFESLQKFLYSVREESNGRALPQRDIIISNITSPIDNDIYKAIHYEVILSNVIYERADQLRWSRYEPFVGTYPKVYDQCFQIKSEDEDDM